MWLYQHEKTVKTFVSEDMRKYGKKWYEHPDFTKPSYKEGTLRVKQKAEELMLFHGYRHDDERNLYIAERPNKDRIALFAHEGFGLIFLSCLLDIPYPEMSTRFALQHSGVIVIEFPDTPGEVIPHVLTWSNDSHIFAERLPLKYQNRIQF